MRWSPHITSCRKVESSQCILAALRNILILSSVLGLGSLHPHSQISQIKHPGFLLSLMPANMIQQYVFNIINGLAGVFILVTTVLLNKNVVINLPSHRSTNSSNSSRLTVNQIKNQHSEVSGGTPP